ncbi:hypothetical protein OSB04_019280 [Centaurea solstitialis]|uniref:DUF8039 domain-containing protein n=1 Tax=Centaurea solstitialis TaxID=347529 RepID=A0AA38W4W4_9ASTR|nr:hypothetical protein OSB04_019280 [Centaurea solstitialis]
MKDGECKDDSVKNVANESISHEKEIAQGSIKPNHGTDALSSSNERTVELEKQLDVERQGSESTFEEFKHLSVKIKMKDEESKELSITTCQLAYPSLRNIVARGRVYYSSEIQTNHGVALKDDCYRVSIDE